MHRQGYGKCRSNSFLAFDGDVAAVVFDEPVADRKTQSHAFDLALGGEEAVKNFVKMLFPDAAAGVGDVNHNIAALGGGADRQHSAMGHGVARVGDHVQKDLAQLVFRRIDQAQTFRQTVCNLDIVFP